MKTIFVCSGNVGRSQIAEGYYNHFTNTQDATSAGCDPATPAKWKHPAPEAVEVMKEEGIDISKKLVKLVTEEMVTNTERERERERVIVLCKREECQEFLLRHPNIEFWEIADPYQTSIENFRVVRNQIKAKVQKLL